jgi:protein-S-isoprenylcysteine O-methyltransferase Ste14
MSQQSTVADKGKVAVQAIETFLFGVIALGAVLCLTAWTLNYWQAWAFSLVFMALLALSGAYFSVKDPALIERRKEAGPAAEQSTGRKINIMYVYILEIGMLLLSALDRRFGWSHMLTWVSMLGIGFVILANVIWFISKRENSYAGSAIKIYEGQKVVTTGTYARVRHPNYAGDLILTLGIPLALGSWWGLVVFALLIPSMVWKIYDEEKLLKRDLRGYAEYTRKVRSRLVPYIW